ncbi:MAG: FAD-binding protein [Candidatus Ranarchaeia archaeon]
MINSSQEKKIQEIFGDRFSSDQIEKEAQTHDIADLPFIANWVLKPKIIGVVQPINTEEISNFVKLCQKKKINILPKGGSTSGYGGCFPTKPSVSIDFRRMNEIVELNEEKLFVKVQPGVIWQNLDNYLKEKGYALATYPSSAPSATVGGWVAQGGVGIGGASEGSINEQIIDLEIVLPNGEIVNSSKLELEHDSNGNRVFIGTYGSFGLITEIILKIIPNFEVVPILTQFSNNEKAIHAFEEMRNLSPYHMHFVDSTFNELKNQVEDNKEEDASILIIFKNTIGDKLSELKIILGKYGGKILDEEIANHAWDERFYSMRIKRLGPSLTPSEIVIPINQFRSTYRALKSRFKSQKLALEGTLIKNDKVVILTYFLADKKKRFSFLFSWGQSQDIVDIGIENGGKPYSIGLWLTPYQNYIFGKQQLKDLKKVKKKIDQNNIMNPGKVIVGKPIPSIFVSLLILLLSVGFFSIVPIIFEIIGFNLVSLHYLNLFWNEVNYLLQIIVPINLQLLYPSVMQIPTILRSIIPTLFPEPIITGIIFGLVFGVLGNIVLRTIPFSWLLRIGKPFLSLGSRIFI